MSGKYSRPLYLNSVKAGFPSPADDFIESNLDLNQFLVKNPPATFFLRVAGDSMKGRQIVDGDLLIVDRSITPKSGDVILASINNEFTVKILDKDKHQLLPANNNYNPIHINNYDEFEIWGVIKHVIHSFNH